MNKQVIRVVNSHFSFYFAQIWTQNDYENSNYIEKSFEYREKQEKIETLKIVTKN